MLTQTDLLIAYRKAKYEALRDRNCAHGRKFCEFERDFDKNIGRLLRRLKSSGDGWFEDTSNLGSWSYIPKAGPVFSQPTDTHFNTSDSFDAWTSAWNRAVGAERKAEFREVIDASVELQVISALWCTTVGVAYDAALSRRNIFGSRLRTRGPSGRRTINRNCFPLFHHYPTAYGTWQKTGLKRIRDTLNEGETVAAITMDMQQYYHSIDVGFLKSREFLNVEPAIILSSEDRRLNSKLSKAIRALQSVALGNGRFGLPVGLTASAVLANSFLRGLDGQILTDLSPVYYGRYVDDIFLVVKPGKKISSDEELVQWLIDRLHGTLSKVDGCLRFKRPEFLESQIKASQSKQKIFMLDGAAGLDLIQPIAERLREQASIARSLPLLPRSSSGITRRILSVASGAEANALRKADSVSLQRAEFALALASAERYSRALPSPAWAETRSNFVDVATRHLLTPRGFFDLFSYIPRLFRLLARCNDERGLRALVTAAQKLRDTLNDTLGASRAVRAAFDRCWKNLGLLVQESIIAASDNSTQAMQYNDLIRKAWRSLRIAQVNIWSEFKTSDWLDQIAQERWLHNEVDDASVPPPSVLAAVPRQWRWPRLTRLADVLGIRAPHWRTILFATHGARLSVLSSVLASAGHLKRFRMAANSMRGLSLRRGTPVSYSPADENVVGHYRIVPPRNVSEQPRVALANMLTTKEQWRRAVLGDPDLSVDRFENISRLVNDMVDGVQRWRRENPRLAVYVVLPELALPREWLFSVVKKLGEASCSVICGVEYRFENGKPINEVIVGLSVGSVMADLVVIPQRKRAAAWEEQNNLRELLGVGHPTSILRRDIFHHGRFSFSVLICNELTDIDARSQLRGQVDAVFVPEWNQDIDGFSTLIESSALDIHAFVVQANNRAYGDSRIRAPFRDAWERDVVRVKGGTEDHFVLGNLSVTELRKFQTGKEPALGPGARFKPFPTGFALSKLRRRS